MKSKQKRLKIRGKKGINSTKNKKETLEDFTSKNIYKEIFDKIAKEKLN